MTELKMSSHHDLKYGRFLTSTYLDKISYIIFFFSNCCLIYIQQNTKQQKHNNKIMFAMRNVDIMELKTT